MKRMKGYAKRMRKLQDDLDYWNMTVRLETRWLRQSKEKVKEIEDKMKELNNQLLRG